MPAKPVTTEIRRPPVRMLRNLEFDMLRAMQYLYYVKAISMVSDKEFDVWEKQYVADTGNELPVGSDREDSYPPAVRALALYLSMSVYAQIQEEKLL
jgi:hypothetical protein